MFEGTRHSNDFSFHLSGMDRIHAIGGRCHACDAWWLVYTSDGWWQHLGGLTWQRQWIALCAGCSQVHAFFEQRNWQQDENGVWHGVWQEIPSTDDNDSDEDENPHPEDASHENPNPEMATPPGNAYEEDENSDPEMATRLAARQAARQAATLARRQAARLLYARQQDS